MKTFVVRYFCFLVVLASLPTLSLFAQTNQLLSLPEPAQAPADSGSGDSLTPIISPDGRYVLFASTANNLVTLATNKPIPAVSPAPLNVFLRDRSNTITTLVSVNAAGTGGGNDNSWPIAISTNGQYVLFESAASDLVSGDTNKATDVFVRDLVNGQTLLVSVNTNGTVGNRASSGSAMTPDGRYVAFVSGAMDLMPNDTNGIPDVFVRDLQSSNTVLASVGARALSTPVQPSIISPDISSDGRYVLFSSPGTNLVSNVKTANEIYLRDLVSGTTAWASSGATQAVQAVFNSTTSASFNYLLSPDGQFVAYQASPANTGGLIGTTGIILRYNALTGLSDVVYTNAVAFSLGNNRNLDMTPDGRFIAFIGNTNIVSPKYPSVLVWDGQSGATVLASPDRNNQIPVNATFAWPTFDSSGRFVAFLSSATNLVTNTIPGDFHLYVRDLQAGLTTLVDADTNGLGVTLNTTPVPSMSADGRFVAFESPDSKLVPRDFNSSLDVFVRDTSSNATELISVRATALPSSSPSGPNTLSLFSVSSDGRYVAFSSDANNLVPNDTNSSRDIIVRDLLLGTNLLVSANTNSLTANNFSSDPAISGDGRFVAFTSAATDLVPGDTNKATDIFGRDLQTGITTLISVNSNGIAPGNKASFSPLISSNGRYVLFHSAATDLAPVSAFTADNLFLRDRQSGTTTALTTGGASSFTAMTPDGHYIAFVGTFGSSNLFVWDTQISARIYTNSTSGIAAVALSPDGRRLVYGISSGLYVADPVAHSSGSLITANHPFGARLGLRFSADSRFFTAALATSIGGTKQVYLIDLQTSSTLLVSHTFNSISLPANAASDSPDMSADGRFIAYRSLATDILPTDANGVPDIFLYDKQTGLTTVLTQSRFANHSADNRSRLPVFSADGKILFFESSASDLVDQTFNFNPNIFAYGTYVMPPFPVALAFDTQGPMLSWPAVPGKTYQVQFKTALSDSWQDLNGDMSVIGNTEYFHDPSPSPLLRFYRVKSF